MFYHWVQTAVPVGHQVLVGWRNRVLGTKWFPSWGYGRRSETAVGRWPLDWVDLELPFGLGQVGKNGLFGQQSGRYFW